MWANWTSSFTVCLKATSGGQNEKMSTTFRGQTKNLFMWKAEVTHTDAMWVYSSVFSSKMRAGKKKRHTVESVVEGGRKKRVRRKEGLKCWNETQLLVFPQSTFKQGYGCHMYIKKYCSNKEQKQVQQVWRHRFTAHSSRPTGH